jgi:hypothetical protein
MNAILAHCSFVVGVISSIALVPKSSSASRYAARSASLKPDVTFPNVFTTRHVHSIGIEFDQHITFTPVNYAAYPFDRIRQTYMQSLK